MLHLLENLEVRDGTAQKEGNFVIKAVKCYSEKLDSVPANKFVCEGGQVT